MQEEVQVTALEAKTAAANSSQESLPTTVENEDPTAPCANLGNTDGRRDRELVDQIQYAFRMIQGAYRSKVQGLQHEIQVLKQSANDKTTKVRTFR